MHAYHGLFDQWEIHLAPKPQVQGSPAEQHEVQGFGRHASICISGSTTGVAQESMQNLGGTLAFGVDKLGRFHFSSSIVSCSNETNMSQPNTSQKQSDKNNEISSLNTGASSGAISSSEETSCHALRCVKWIHRACLYNCYGLSPCHPGCLHVLCTTLQLPRQICTFYYGSPTKRKDQARDLHKLLLPGQLSASPCPQLAVDSGSLVYLETWRLQGLYPLDSMHHFEPGIRTHEKDGFGHINWYRSVP